MMCYKDQTFCVWSNMEADNRCTNQDCFRYLTEFQRKQAIKMDLPVAWGDCKTDDCGYTQENH